MSQNSIQQLAESIKASPKSKIIFMVGAGISTSAGIPDFRSPKTGLYHNLQKLSLPYAEAVFDIDFFKNNPKPFYLLSKELYPGQFKPTKFHLLMKLFEIKGKLQRIYTQNIDTLERIANINEEKIIEAHGSFAKNHCIDCHKEYPYDLFHSKIKTFDDEAEFIKCESCKGLIKPDIVFFGEGLPTEFFDSWEKDLDDFNSNDIKDKEFIAITAGTSLTVYPFASLPSEVPKRHVRVLVNKELVGDFKNSKRKNDYIFVESSDEFSENLVDELGWTKEFNELVKKNELKHTADKETEINAYERSKLVSKEIENELQNEIEDELKKEEEVIKNLKSLDIEDK